MLGFEDFMVRLISDEPFSTKFIEKILTIQIAMYDIMLDGAGPYVHIVETAEDYGTSNSLLLSPHTYRKMIMPARKRILLQALVEDDIGYLVAEFVRVTWQHYFAVSDHCGSLPSCV